MTPQEERNRVAIKQIQDNRAIPVRRESLDKTIFQIKEGHNIWFVRYSKNHKTVEEVEERVARFLPNDKVCWVRNRQPIEGKIAVVVPPNMRLTDKLQAFRDAGYDTTQIEKSDRARHQASYLVAIKKILYWPLVSNLRKINES